MSHGGCSHPSAEGTAWESPARKCRVSRSSHDVSPEGTARLRGPNAASIFEALSRTPLVRSRFATICPCRMSRVWVPSLKGLGNLYLGLPGTSVPAFPCRACGTGLGVVERYLRVGR